MRKGCRMGLLTYWLSFTTKEVRHFLPIWLLGSNPKKIKHGYIFMKGFAHCFLCSLCCSCRVVTWASASRARVDERLPFGQEKCHNRFSMSWNQHSQLSSAPFQSHAGLSFAPLTILRYTVTPQSFLLSQIWFKRLLLPHSSSWPHQMCWHKFVAIMKARLVKKMEKTLSLGKRSFKVSLPVRKVYMDSITSVFLCGIQRSGSQSEYCPVLSQHSVFLQPTALQKFEHCNFLIKFIIALHIFPNNIVSNVLFSQQLININIFFRQTSPYL